MNWKYRAGALLLALLLVLPLSPAVFATGGAAALRMTLSSEEIIIGKTGTLTLSLTDTTAAGTVLLINGTNSVATLDRSSVSIAAGQSAAVNITAVAEGSTTVQVFLNNNYAGEVTIKVVKDPDTLPIEARLTADSQTTTQGTAVNIYVNLSRQTATITDVSWGSRENLVVEGKGSPFSYTAKFLSSAVGSYDLAATVKLSNGDTLTSNTIEIQVNEKPVTPPKEEPARGISIAGNTNYVYINRSQSHTLAALTTPADATDPVTWELQSGAGIIELLPNAENDRRCTVRGITPGAAVVVAKVKGKNGEFTSDPFTVEVNGLVLDKTEVEVFEQGDPVALVVTAYGTAKSMNLSWESQSEPIASVRAGASGSATVTGNSVGTATVTAYAGANKNYTAECKVTVKENVAGLIERSVSGGKTYVLSGVISDLRKRCVEMTEDSLKLLRGIYVDPAAGILHYNYVSPEFQGQGVGNEAYYVNPSGTLERDLSKITFAPKTGFSGNADIHYTGESAGGKNFSGIIRISVADTGDVTYNTASNLPVVFRTEDFTAICRPRTGQEIRYVSFQQPTSGRGTLYRTYSAAAQYNAPVTASDKFYRTSSPRLDEVTFLPEEDYTGTVKLPYLCTTTSGGSYTGTVTINVYDASSETTGKGDVNYTVAPGSYVTLSDGDFNDVTRAATGNTLDYVYFDLPAASRGTLYLNYRSASNPGSRVSADTRYYRSSSPRISSITFVPASGFTGSVSVPFTAFDRQGENVRGTMVIQVTENDGTIRYTTGENRPVTFDGQDFNEACQKAGGASLDYITFDTPSTSRGRLYRNYRSSSSTGTSVWDSTRLYYRGDPAISDVTFVPARNYNGTVTIPFSGYDSSGKEYSGTLVITVGTGSSSSDVVAYSTVSGGLVSFSASDFDGACQAILGGRLNYVRFTSLPASRYGTLYYQYNSSRGTGTSVTTSTSYYRAGSSRLIGDVSFLASAGASGTTSFEYTGWNDAGRQFTGTVEITISSPQSQVVRYTTTSGQVAFQTSDFRSACTASTGGTLAYIRFNSLPSGGAGQLSADGVYASTGTSYYADGSAPAISGLRFIPAGGYWGTVRLSYTGWDTQGRSHSGTVEISVNNNAGTGYPGISTSFTDLGNYSQEFQVAINYLSSTGVVGGYGDGRFGPGQPVSRGAFALMVCRAFNLNTGGTSSFPDVPSNSVYGWAVATARDLGIAEGNNGRFNPGSPITRQAAMTMICRAMQAAGREAPNVSTNVLSSYPDSGQISAYARSSLASLVYMGAVKGDASGRLNPGQSISRAQMAVILYRVLTTS